MKDEFIHWISAVMPISQEEEAAMSEILTERVIKKGDILVKPGRVCDTIYFVLKGCFRSYFLKDGEEITDYFFFEGAFVSDYASLYSGKPSDFFLEAIEDSEAVSYTRSDFLVLSQRLKKFETFGRVHAEKAFLEVEKRMRMLHQEQLEGRFARMMEDFPQLFQRAPQYQIASYLGVKPESLSRIKGKMTRSHRS